MNKRFIRIASIFAVICFLILTLTSCTAKGSGQPTRYAYEKNAKESQTANNYDDQVDWAEYQIAFEILELGVKKLDTGGYAGYDKEKLDTLKEDLKKLVLSNKKEDYSQTVNDINTLADLIIKEHNDSLVGLPVEEQERVVNPIASAIIEYIIEGSRLQVGPTQYVDYLNLSGKKELEKAEADFRVILIKADIERFKEIFKNATDYKMLTTGEIEAELTEEQKQVESHRTYLVEAFNKKGGCFGATSTLTKAASEIDEKYREELTDVNVYEALVAFMITVEDRRLEQEPIHFQLRFSSFGTFMSDFFGNFFDNFLVYPVGIVLWFTSSLFGGWYIIGLFITTLLIRTAGWPIYAKTNDMSLKMQVIQPEMQKLEEKYKNRQDPDSQRMKQAELAQIYKRNKIGLGGCFLPFLQFPIFMAVYGAVRRFPYTIATPGTGIFEQNDWAKTTIFGGQMHSSLFGIPFDLFEDYSAGTLQLIGIIILVLLVCGTQFLSQFLSERRQKTNHEKSQEDIPAYRRQAYKQTNNQGQNTMKYVMYMMIFMMGTFVFSSKAGLGIYWLIGNLYSMLQMFINNALGQKKLKKMKEKANQYR